MTSVVCECGSPDHSGFVDAADLIREREQHQAARDWLTTLLAATPDADTVQLNRVGIASEVAVQLRHDPRQLRAMFLAELNEQLTEASRVRRLQYLMRDGTEHGPAKQVRNAASSLHAMGGQDAIARCERTEALVNAFAGGLFLAAQARLDEQVSLARCDERGIAYSPTRFRVQVPTLADYSTRNQMRLAGHPSSRKQTVGHDRAHTYGAQRRRFPSADGHGQADEQELEAGAEAGTGTDSPKDFRRSRGRSGRSRRR